MIKKIKYMDKKLLIASILLFSLGLVMIYSASNVTAYMLNETNPGRYFTKELLFLITGIIGCIILLSFNTKSYALGSWLLTIAMGISIFCLIIYGKATNGANNWIGYKGFGIQPSEFAKIAIIPLMATYYEQNIRNNDNFKRMIIPLLVAAVITILIVLQKDFGTALIYMILSVTIFFLSPVSTRIKKGIFKIGIVGILFLAALVMVGGDKIIPQDKLERFNYNNPCSRYLKEGNQLCNGYIAINGGGVFGKGLGNSTQKYLYLPEAHTDFIFAIFVEELGIIGVVVLFLIYLFLILRLVATGKKATKPSHALICYGVSIYIFLHIAINLGGVLGIIPMTGIPLIFMSYGGSICWCTLIALTMVQRVNYEMKKTALTHN